ncbi:histidine kinase [Sphingobacterium siyangense]|uniref:Histidine kinase n=2 Tax=Sphingobacterium siyangense TaxID=459529 RepID=A0A562MGY7_9SPHI|nr:histidine kinase [Sphingobacterium siyangense]
MPVGEKFTSTSRTLLVLVRGGLINWLISFLVLHLEGMREKERAQLELEYLKQAHLQANLSSLKEQLSPHFLFNTLSALASLTKEQSVKDYIEELSSIYRYLLKHRESDLVTLKNEIAFCESYLYIIKTRLENAIEILIELTEDISNVQIPPLTLQLLIENAIKHNVAAHYKPLKIHIYVSSNSSLIVENNLQPKHSREKSSGIGLKNISQRYKVLLGQEITIEKTDTFFKIHLPLVL